MSSVIALGNRRAGSVAGFAVAVLANGFAVGLPAGAFDVAGLSVFAPAFGLETVSVDEAVLAAGAVLAGGALGALALAALALAFVAGVVFVAFATRFLPAVIDWPDIRPDAGRVAGKSSLPAYVLRLSTAVQALPQRQGWQRFAAGPSIRLCRSEGASPLGARPCRLSDSLAENDLHAGSVVLVMERKAGNSAFGKGLYRTLENSTAAADTFWKADPAAVTPTGAGGAAASQAKGSAMEFHDERN